MKHSRFQLLRTTALLAILLFSISLSALNLCVGQDGRSSLSVSCECPNCLAQTPVAAAVEAPDPCCAGNPALAADCPDAHPAGPVLKADGASRCCVDLPAVFQLCLLRSRALAAPAPANVALAANLPQVDQAAVNVPLAVLGRGCGPPLATMGQLPGGYFLRI